MTTATGTPAGGQPVPEDVAYLDNAATTWPKPPAVAKAMSRYLEAVGGSPGRGGHRRAVDAGRIVFDTREALADLLGAPDLEQVILLKNATEALNLALLGILRPGDRVVVSSLEHNSVMRPLRHLEAAADVEVHVVQAHPQGSLEPAALAAALTEPTRLVVTTHGSNVTGALAPLGELATVAHDAGAMLLVDAAQTAGAHPLDVTALGIDLLAFTGHKSLLGPQGTGGLVIAGEVPEPIIFGGTGSNSEAEWQPELLPDRLESGTLNGVGFAGLGAGVGYVAAEGVERIAERGRERLARLLDGLARIPGVKLHGPADPERQIGVVSLEIEGRSPAEVGMLLDERYGVLTRVGLHCSPAAHRTIGTYPVGTVRLSLSGLTPDDHIDRAIAAIRELATP